MNLSRVVRSIAVTALAVVSIGTIGCGGDSGDESETTEDMSVQAETAAKPPEEISPLLSKQAANLERAGYEISPLTKAKDLRNFVGPPGNPLAAEVVAEAGLKVFGPKLGGETSGSGGATLYAFVESADAAALGEALVGVANEVRDHRIYFVGQSPPSVGLSRLVAVAEK